MEQAMAYESSAGNSGAIRIFEHIPLILPIMKRVSFLFVFLAILLGLPSFAQVITKKRGKVVNYVNGVKVSAGKVKHYRKQGTWQYWNQNGRLVKTVTYKDDRMEGPFIEYYENGNVKEQGNYIAGKKNGEWNKWYADKTRKSQLFFTNDKTDSLQRYWYENGTLRQELLIRHGEKVYDYKWFSNGRPSYVKTFKDGLAEGTWREYRETRNPADTFPSTIIQYSRGLREGKLLKYDKGKLRQECFYKRDQLDGNLKIWDDEGNVVVDENYTAGKLNGLCRYYKSGVLVRETEYTDGKINGEEKLYSLQTGKLNSNSWARKGVLDSVYTYYPSGKTESTRIYKYFPGFAYTEEFSYYTLYDTTGKKLSDGEYHFSNKDKTWTTYYPNGKVKSQTPYSNGKIIGVYKKWYMNGKPLIEMECENGNVVSQPKVWDEKGRPLKPGTKAYDELVESSKPGEVYNNPLRYRNSNDRRYDIPPPPPPIMDAEMIMEGDDEGPVEIIEEAAPPQTETVFAYAEEMPGYPGGEDSLKAFVKRNLRFPAVCQEAGVQGTVYLQFVVEKDGSVTNIHPAKTVPGCPQFTDEAIRVMGIMPRWSPGKMNGRPIRVTMTMPIRFTIQ